MRFTLRQLEYLVAVAEHGSVAGAAASLQVSRGTLSQSLSDLERVLRADLLSRKASKGSTLTPAGRVAVDIARRVLAESEAMDNLGAKLAGRPFGRLRVGCYSTLAPWLAPRLQTYFATRHPAVELTIRDQHGTGMADDVADGRLDVVIAFTRRVHNPRVRLVPVSETHVMCMVGREHALADRDKVTLAELADFPATVLNIFPGVDLVTDVMQHAGLRAKVEWRADQFETVRSMVGHGFGYTLTMGVPHSDRAVDGSPLTIVPTDSSGYHSPVVAVLPSNQRPSAAVSELLHATKSLLTELDTPTS